MKFFKSSKILFTYIFYAMVFHGYAQTAEIPLSGWREAGTPFLRNFSPGEYRGHYQNWWVAQNVNGIVYVANNDGLLEYDGVNWRRNDAGGRLRSVRSLAIDAAGTLFAGAGREFGYFSADSAGNQQFISLLPLVAEEQRDFSDVWQTHASGDAVYFVSHKYLFRWANRHMTVLPAQTSFHTSFAIGEKLFIRQPDIGLMQLQDDSLRLVPGGAEFAAKNIYFMQPYDETTCLIGTATGGFYLFDGTSVTPFPTQLDSYLAENRLYCGARLPDGNYAMGTVRGGMVLMDLQGNLLQIVNENTGLQDNTVFYIHPDQQGGLWLALNNGISRVQIPAPLSIYTKINGLNGSVEKTIRHRGVIYAATNLGVFFLDTTAETLSGSPEKFKPLPGIEGFSWSFLSMGDTLLIATESGVYQVTERHTVRRLGQWELVFSFCRPAQDGKRIYLALRDGVGILRREGNRWTDGGRLAGISEKVYRIVEDADGSLWLETLRQGITQVRFAPASGEIVQVTHFDTTNGLPPGRIFPLVVNNRVKFSTWSGMWDFDPATRHFSRDSTFDLPGTWAFLGTEDPQARFWVTRYEAYGKDDRVHVGTFRNGSYQWTQLPSFRIRDVTWVNDIYPEPDGGAWIGTTEGLVRYDPHFNLPESEQLAVLIRRVLAGGDSLVFGGTSPESTATVPPPVLPFASNALRFEYALPDFASGNEITYQTFLEGFDTDWSAWNPETRKDYTNLPDGRYTFRVRARTVFGDIHPPASYAFEILPPWYRSPGSYAVYFILLFVSVVLIDRTQRSRLVKREQEKARLREAEIVRQKNTELSDKNDQLEKGLQALKSAQANLSRSESRFRSVAQSANDAIITADCGGLITYWNSSAEKMFGYSKAEITGKPLTILIPARYRQMHDKGIDRTVKKGQTRKINRMMEVHALRKDGSEFPIELSVASWESEEGTFVTGIIRDITLRKQAQEDLEQTRALLEAENRRKSEELEKARQLQLSLLPKELPGLPGIEMDACMTTATEVGGDYYDVHCAPDNALTVVVGDATGHGLNAGMMVAATKSILESLSGETNPARLLEKLNRVLLRLNLHRLYMGLQIIRIKDNQLEMSSAGMPPLLIHRAATGTVEELVIKAMPLGAISGYQYPVQTAEIAPGDTILLMSDGLPERFNKDREMFDYPRVKQVFKEIAHHSPGQIIRCLEAAGNEWANGRPPDDDITFVVLKVK